MWYIITMRSEQEVQEEQRKAQARAERWNESVQRVRELTRQWQRDNEAHLGPFLQPVEDEEN
jgi:Flp pilus assembly protein TadD